MPGSPGIGPQNVHFDVPLTNFALQYGHTEYLSYQVAPVVNVRHESDKYYVWNSDREDIVRPNALRAIGTPSNEIKFGIAQDTYSCDEYALNYPLADRIRDNADDVMRLRERSTKQILDMLDLDKELRLQALYQTTGGSVPSTTVVVKWDTSTAVPELDISAAKSAIRTAIGKEPNSILLSVEVADALVQYLKVAIAGSIDMGTKVSFTDLPPVLWGLKVYIAKGNVRTGNPGQAIVTGTTITPIWNDNVVIFYQEENPGMETMCFIKTFQSRPFMTKTWRNEIVSSEIIESSVIECEKMCAPLAAYILDAALT
jgi:hypothetical protein